MSIAYLLFSHRTAVVISREKSADARMMDTSLANSSSTGCSPHVGGEPLPFAGLGIIGGLSQHVKSHVDVELSGIEPQERPRLGKPPPLVEHWRTLGHVPVDARIDHVARQVASGIVAKLGAILGGRGHRVEALGTFDVERQRRARVNRPARRMPTPSRRQPVRRGNGCTLPRAHPRAATARTGRSASAGRSASSTSVSRYALASSVAQNAISSHTAAASVRPRTVAPIVGKIRMRAPVASCTVVALIDTTRGDSDGPWHRAST